MTDYKLVPVEPTAEMVCAAEDAYMPFGDMDLALRMAVLAAPAVQGDGEWPIVDVAPEHSHISCAKYPDLFEYHLAISGEGDHAYTWSDKPHRLVYSLTRDVAHLRDRISAMLGYQYGKVKP